MWFFEWLEGSALAVAIRQTTWLMPLFNTIHALGMTLLIGSILFVSLRLLGVSMAQRPVWQIAGEARRWTIAGLLTMVTTGLLLFIPESLRWYGSGPFRVKMTCLLVAVVFHFTLFRKVTSGDKADPTLCRITGTLALILWFGVGWGGRAITFLE